MPAALSARRSQCHQVIYIISVSEFSEIPRECQTHARFDSSSKCASTIINAIDVDRRDPTNCIMSSQAACRDHDKMAVGGQGYSVNSLMYTLCKINKLPESGPFKVGMLGISRILLLKGKCVDSIRIERKLLNIP